jgi:threonine aldolase
MKYSFKNDYSEGAHPSILEALSASNFEQQNGYCDDLYSTEAKNLIRKKIQNPDAEVFFLSGGTQANLIAIAAMLRPFESVIAAATGHINVHETGAIEATGHKINTIVSPDGKISASTLQAIVNEHKDDPPHMVQPRMVYISNSTEIGTIYRKSELEELSAVCKANNLYLYMDGARLGSALTSVENDISLPELSALLDAFYIGGTKNGGLIGEAIVINNPIFIADFPYHLKQRGALLGKGRIFGIQFREFFKDNLYFEMADHANKMARKLTDGMKKAGYPFLTDSPTNQIFPILPFHIIDKLSENYEFYVWKKLDEHTAAIRLVTSWATKEEAVDEFLEDLKLCL